MENKLKTLFKGQDPSVRLFNEKMKELTTQQADLYYAHAYILALVGWKELNVTYRNFLKRLVGHDRQRFLDFLHGNILGELRYSFREPLLAARLLALMEVHDEKQRMSDSHLAFSFLLGFGCTLRLETIGKTVASRTFMPEELQDIKGKAIIDTGQ